MAVVIQYDLIILMNSEKKFQLLSFYYFIHAIPGFFS